jgi:hypothetical protein
MSAEARLAGLDAHIEQLTVDAYDEDEQLTGLLTGVEEALRPPEAATIVGVPVQVVAVTAGRSTSSSCWGWAGADCSRRPGKQSPPRATARIPAGSRPLSDQLSNGCGSSSDAASSAAVQASARVSHLAISIDSTSTPVSSAVRYAHRASVSHDATAYCGPLRSSRISFHDWTVSPAAEWIPDELRRRDRRRR